MSKRNAGPSNRNATKKSRRGSSDENDESEFSHFHPPSPLHEKLKEAEYGIIEHISMKNFMCHDRLEFNFGPHINFLVGLNGSGKSAVLTALVVGLGGKASSTSRGTSIKNFIKHGRNKAMVVVKLRNRGTDAYKWREYGNTIIVERHFSMDGSSQYKIKSGDGRVISTKRDELCHILDQFNVQVDNPIAVLNQDTSKNFLSSGRPSNYYRFFLKATQLEQMQLDYMEAHEQRKVTMNIVEEKTRLLPQLEAEVLKWEAKYKAIMSLDELRDKVVNLKNELAWAFVVEEEKQLQPMVNMLKTEQSRTPKFEAKIRESKEKLEKVTSEKDEIHQKLQAMSSEVKIIQPLHDKAKGNVINKKKTHRDILMEMRRIELDMQSQVKDKRQLIERIEEIRASAPNNDQERADRERRIKELNGSIESLKEQRATRELDMTRFQSAVAKDRNEIRKFKNDEREFHSQILDLQRRMTDLEGSRNNNLARYGRWMPQLLQKIEDAHRRGRFHQKPRGPIGANIHPRDPQWALAIETALKRLIRSFCCHDHHDENVLEQIMRECSIPNKPDTIVSQFMRATGPYQTMFDMLEIKDPVIANCLIDQRRIENVILIEDKVEARKVMEKNPPPNARECFTPNGDQLFHKPSFKIYSSNNQRPEYLSVNVERDLVQLRDQIQVLSGQLTHCQQRINDKQREMMKNELEEKKIERLLMQSRDSVNRLTLEIQELQNIEDPAPADIITLEEEVEKYDENIEALDVAMKDKKSAAELAKRELEEANEVLKEVDKKMTDMTENVDPLRDSLTNVEYRITRAKEEKKHYDDKMKIHQANLKEQADRIAVFRLNIEQKVQMAGEMCERIEVKRAPRNLESEIIQIQKQIETQERTQGDKKTIVEQYHAKTESYKEIKHEVNRFNTFLERLVVSIVNRRGAIVDMRRSIAARTRNLFTTMLDVMNYCGRLSFKWAKEELHIIRLKRAMSDRQLAFADMRRMIAVRTRYIFITMLSSRHYMGKLVFDHRKETLEVSVQPSVSRSGVGSKDVKALSGGERSFSTVCFILSLWQAMESPFRCLDEFDVFMDMVNRRISMGMMLRAAEAHPHNQFIFLTPLDISTMELRSDVCIYRMPDPERRMDEDTPDDVNDQ